MIFLAKTINNSQLLLIFIPCLIQAFVQFDKLFVGTLLPFIILLKFCIKVSKTDAYLFFINSCTESKLAVHIYVYKDFSSALLKLFSIYRSLTYFNENAFLNHFVCNNSNSSSCDFQSTCHINS